MSGLYAGAGKVDITPPVGVELDGNLRAKPSQGIHDRLWSETVVFKSGDESVAVVSNDLLVVPKKIVTRSRIIAEEECGIDGKNILICATHTHSGPATCELLARPDQNYVQTLPRKIAESIGRAKDGLREAEVGVGIEVENTIPHNRRILMESGSVRMNWENLPLSQVDKPAGPIDDEVIVCKIEDKKGALIASLVNYACHPAILGGDNFLISADYPGVLTNKIQKKLGGVCLFTSGALGNVNHINYLYDLDKRDFFEVNRVGSLLSRKVLGVLEDISTEDVHSVNAKTEKISLKLRDIPPDLIKWAEMLLNQSREVSEAAPDGITPPIYAKFILEQSEKNLKKIETELQVISIGDSALVGIPGELFVELGLQIKENSPFAHTFLIGLANDYIGYLPTKASFQEGGYEVTLGPTSRLSPDSGHEIVEKAIKSLGGLR